MRVENKLASARNMPTRAATPIYASPGFRRLSREIVAPGKRSIDWRWSEDWGRCKWRACLCRRPSLIVIDGARLAPTPARDAANWLALQFQLTQSQGTTFLAYKIANEHRRFYRPRFLREKRDCSRINFRRISAFWARVLATCAEQYLKIFKSFNGQGSYDINTCCGC